jgi:hypothetical protein
MSAIPGEPLKPKPHELTLKDGTKLKLKLPPGMPRPVKPVATEQRGGEDPAKDNPAPLHNPLHGGI